MRAVWIIALNTFREIIRDRILYGIVVFALLLIGVSLVLGQLSFAEQARISANFGFTGIQMSACVLAIFAGSTLVSREIEKQTVLTLLARPVSRAQFITGKWLGLSLVVLSVTAGLALVLLGVISFLGLNAPVSTIVVALSGVLFEALLLTSLAIFFGSFARPIMTVIFSAAFFLIGHWVTSLDFFVERSQDPVFKIVAGSLGKIVPDLERFNWRAAPIYGTEIPAHDIAVAALYAAGWVVFLLFATSLIFRRRDFV